MQKISKTLKLMKNFPQINLSNPFWFGIQKRQLYWFSDPKRDIETEKEEDDNKTTPEEEL